jgi:hypothetical protein
MANQHLNHLNHGDKCGAFALASRDGRCSVSDRRLKTTAKQIKNSLNFATLQNLTSVSSSFGPINVWSLFHHTAVTFPGQNAEGQFRRQKADNCRGMRQWKRHGRSGLGACLAGWRTLHRTVLILHRSLRFSPNSSTQLSNSFKPIADRSVRRTSLLGTFAD